MTHNFRESCSRWHINDQAHGFEFDIIPGHCFPEFCEGEFSTIIHHQTLLKQKAQLFFTDIVEPLFRVFGCSLVIKLIESRILLQTDVKKCRP